MSARLRRQYAAYCKAYGDAARERGTANEGRLLSAVLSLRAGASWILEARAATPDEDRRGIDVVVISDVGPLRLQSKSSTGAARRFVGHGGIEAVAVSLNDGTTAAPALVALQALRASRRRTPVRPVVVDVGVSRKAAPAPPSSSAKPIKATAQRAKAGGSSRALRRAAHTLRHPNDRPRPPLPIEEQLRRAAVNRARVRSAPNCPLCGGAVPSSTAWSRVGDGAHVCMSCCARLDDVAGVAATREAA